MGPKAVLDLRDDSGPNRLQPDGCRALHVVGVNDGLSSPRTRRVERQAGVGVPSLIVVVDASGEVSAPGASRVTANSRAGTPSTLRIGTRTVSCGLEFPDKDGQAARYAPVSRARAPAIARLTGLSARVSRSVAQSVPSNSFASGAINRLTASFIVKMRPGRSGT